MGCLQRSDRRHDALPHFLSQGCPLVEQARQRDRIDATRRSNNVFGEACARDTAAKNFGCDLRRRAHDALSFKAFLLARFAGILNWQESYTRFLVNGRRHQAIMSRCLA